MSRKVLAVIFWVLVILAPLALTAVALVGLPAGTEQVPMQVGFDGRVNRWGSPSEWWLVGGILAGVNALLALCFRFNDALWSVGLVHGVKNPRSGRIIYMIVALFIVAVTAWIFWFLMSKI